MSILKSLGGIAKQVTGTVSGFRGVLNANPESLGFLLPPQVQIGLQAASLLNTSLGLGLKIPTTDQIKGVSDVISAISPPRGTINKSQLDTILNGAVTKTFPDAPSIAAMDLKQLSINNTIDSLSKVDGSYTYQFPNGDPTQQGLTVDGVIDLLQRIDWLVLLVLAIGLSN